ncbi:MAG: hypothetical protein O2858_02825 [Proteobacteria bacterium]|nr:hypothetical protein [Pseudomonadota bacterium]
MTSIIRWVVLGLALANVIVLTMIVLGWRELQVTKMAKELDGSPGQTQVEINVSPTPSLSGTVSSSKTAQIDRSDQSLKTEAKASPRLEKKIVQAPTKVPNRCLQYGPFSPNERLMLSRSALDLSALSWQFSIHSVVKNASKSAGFRVYLPSSGGLSAAYERLKVVKSQGIDSFVLTDGPYEGGISLGIYSSFTAARNFVSTIQDQLSDVMVGAMVPGQVAYDLIRNDGKEINPVTLASAVQKVLPKSTAGCL